MWHGDAARYHAGAVVLLDEETPCIVEGYGDGRWRVRPLRSPGTLIMAREERLKLDRAYRIEKERFEAEWAERARLVEGESEEKLKVLREVLAIARDDVERERFQRRYALCRHRARPAPARCEREL